VPGGRSARAVIGPAPDANGKAGSGGLRPHEDLLAEFPFLGLPNP